jgi:hypothetical protein
MGTRRSSAAASTQIPLWPRRRPSTATLKARDVASMSSRIEAKQAAWLVVDGRLRGHDERKWYKLASELHSPAYLDSLDIDASEIVRSERALLVAVLFRAHGLVHDRVRDLHVR